jgi:TRAP-type mannitol/chloroaromatic compound transport system permease large subunit
MSFQSMEGEKFVEPAVVSGDEDKEDFLLTANTPVFLL